MGSGFNELKFDDATGKEQVYIHAQKDMDTEVLNDRTTTVKHDHRETVKNDQTVTIQEGNRLLMVKKATRSQEYEKVLYLRMSFRTEARLPVRCMLTL
ncbi:bacteriophage T4 gp5 trimerization domain-containing protein [Escherichia coli]